MEAPGPDRNGMTNQKAAKDSSKTLELYYLQWTTCGNIYLLYGSQVTVTIHCKLTAVIHAALSAKLMHQVARPMRHAAFPHASKEPLRGQEAAP